MRPLADARHPRGYRRRRALCYIPLMLIDADVSLVSVSVRAPSFTANGELVSLVCFAKART